MKALKPFFCSFKLSNFYEFHVCLYLIINVNKIYTFAYIGSSDVNKPKMWITEGRFRNMTLLYHYGNAD